MRAAITGASGLLGGNLAAELVAAGHDVVATRRARTQLAHLDDIRIEWREADLSSADALARAFAGADVVFHCAAAVTIKQDVTPEMTDTNVTGTQRVIDACRTAGVRRLVHTSSVVGIAISPDGRPSDETAAWNFEREGFADAYAITKHRAEQVVRAAGEWIDSVIVNPGYMLGPRDSRPSSGQLLVDVARRRIPGWTPGFNTFVDVRDVARGMIAAAERGRRGERYILGGHELTYRELFERAAAAAGVRPPRLPAPHLVARALGKFGDFKERRGGEPLVNSVQIRYAFTKRFRFTSAKAERELGYTIRPLDETLRDTYAWFRAHAML